MNNQVLLKKWEEATELTPETRSHWILNFIIIKFNLTYFVFIHLVVCLTTGPKPLPKRALHIVRSRASSFK